MFLPTFCEFLDQRTHLCTIYAERFERNPHCLTLEEGIELGVFPADCPYVRGIPGYPPPEEHPIPADLERNDSFPSGHSTMAFAAAAFGVTAAVLELPSGSPWLVPIMLP